MHLCCVDNYLCEASLLGANPLPHVLHAKPLANASPTPDKMMHVVVKMGHERRQQSCLLISKSAAGLTGLVYLVSWQACSAVRD